MIAFLWDRRPVIEHQRAADLVKASRGMIKRARAWASASSSARVVVVEAAISCPPGSENSARSSRDPVGVWISR
jgi:hypothetical protein